MPYPGVAALLPSLGAAGLILDDDWTTFLAAYRDAGGPAVPAGDPWPVLEQFARAAVIHARGVRSRPRR